MAWFVLLEWPGAKPLRVANQKEAERIAAWLRTAVVDTIIYPEGEFPEVNEAGEVVYRKPTGRRAGNA